MSMHKITGKRKEGSFFIVFKQIFDILNLEFKFKLKLKIRTSEI